jgi:hypothetical protein
LHTSISRVCRRSTSNLFLAFPHPRVRGYGTPIRTRSRDSLISPGRSPDVEANSMLNAILFHGEWLFVGTLGPRSIHRSRLFHLNNLQRLVMPIGWIGRIGRYKTLLTTSIPSSTAMLSYSSRIYETRFQGFFYSCALSMPQPIKQCTTKSKISFIVTLAILLLYYNVMTTHAINTILVCFLRLHFALSFMSTNPRKYIFIHIYIVRDLDT